MPYLEVPAIFYLDLSIFLSIFYLDVEYSQLVWWEFPPDGFGWHYWHYWYYSPLPKDYNIFSQRCWLLDLFILFFIYSINC